MTRAAAGAIAPHHIAPRQLLLVLLLTLVWGCTWPVLKMGLTELAPLTFRALTLPFAALSLLAVSKLSGASLRIPRGLWPKVAALALFNIALWNGLTLFGLQQLPAGRSAILAYTMPIWSVLLSLALLHEPLSWLRVAGMALGMTGMAVLLGDDIRHFQRTPIAALMIIGAAFSWGLGTVLLRKWKLPVPQNTLSGWLMILGWMPIALLAPFFAHGPIQMPSATTWFTLLYATFMAGTLAHWAWFTLARTLPVVVSSMSSLPVPIVGVFSSMWLLGERPGPSEWIALGLVVAAMVAVLWPPKARSPIQGPGSGVEPG